MSQEFACPEITRNSGEALAQFRLARINSSNALVYADAGEMPDGRVMAYTGSGLPTTLQLLRHYGGTVRLMAAAAVSTLLAPVYAAADGKVSTTNTGILVGYALETASGDGAIFEVLPCLKRVPMVTTAASANIGASSTSALSFGQTFTIPAVELVAGSILRIKASGIVVGVDSTPQHDVRLVVGTETIATATVAAAAANDQFNIEAEVVFRAVGGSGSLIGQTKDAHDAAGIGALYVNKAAASEDTTGGLTVDVTGQFNASHASNLARLDLLVVEHLRP